MASRSFAPPAGEGKVVLGINTPNLIRLDSQSFQKVKGKKTFLYNNIPGLSAVMFHSADCVHCPKALDEFNKTAGEIPSIRFARLDIKKNNIIYKESKDSDLPILKTPFVVVYKDKKPYMTYNSNKTAEKMVPFFSNLLIQLRTVPTTFGAAAPGRAPPTPKREEKAVIKRSEAECVDGDCGIPYNVICDDDENCYLTEDEISGECKDGECCYMSDAEL